jgi:hypothetical protein
MRRWLNTFAGGSPPWPAHMAGAAPLLANLELDRSQVGAGAAPCGALLTSRRCAPPGEDRPTNSTPPTEPAASRPRPLTAPPCSHPSTPLPQILDRYTQHVQHCRHCSGALARTRRVAAVAQAVSVCAAAAAALGFVFQAAASAAAATAAAAAAPAASGLGVWAVALLGTVAPGPLLAAALLAWGAAAAARGLEHQFVGFVDFDRKPFPASSAASA